MRTLRHRIAKAGAFSAALALGPMLALGPIPAAHAETGSVQATYDISLAGVPIGVARVVARINGAAYDVDLNARLTGLAGVLTSGKGGATSTGTLNGGTTPTPASLAVVSATSDFKRTLRMAFDQGRVGAVEIVPPLEGWERPDRVPVTDSHKRGVVDPLSALLMPVAAGDGGVCPRTIPIFDGATRFDVVLSYTGRRNVSRNAYSGEVTVCNARYVPISGHRPNRSVTRYMEDNRDMDVWLVPVAGTNVYLPYRISVKTMIGTTVLQASRIEMDNAVTASARKKPKAGSTN